ncbi:uncharacterized protein LOC104650701 [Saimiri boliviensis]|uniref:uncharacterized protein LOC104650701 n=1 Tax=Saimiri boliviensis TaxID=27679 RepID=UPI003D77EDA5
MARGRGPRSRGTRVSAGWAAGEPQPRCPRSPSATRTAAPGGRSGPHPTPPTEAARPSLGLTPPPAREEEGGAALPARAPPLWPREFPASPRGAAPRSGGGGNRFVQSRVRGAGPGCWERERARHGTSGTFQTPPGLPPPRWEPAGGFPRAFPPARRGARLSSGARTWAGEGSAPTHAHRPPPPSACLCGCSFCFSLGPRRDLILMLLWAEHMASECWELLSVAIGGNSPAQENSSSGREQVASLPEETDAANAAGRANRVVANRFFQQHRAERIRIWEKKELCILGFTCLEWSFHHAELEVHGAREGQIPHLLWERPGWNCCTLPSHSSLTTALKGSYQGHFEDAAKL